VLNLISSGALALWLEVTGTTLPPPPEFWPLSEVSGLAFDSGIDRATETLVDTYLQGLAAGGIEPADQGIWLQAGTQILVSRRGTVPRSAASITKVATSLVALQTWALDRQFETMLSATGSIRNGVLEGDLIVTGGGDPLFVWEEAIGLAVTLDRMGVRRVTGDLIVEGRFAMNFETDLALAGRFLKQAFDARQWTPEIEAAYTRLPTRSPKPQVDVLGEVRNGNANPPTTGRWGLVRHRSLPLVSLLKQMNVHSNNVMAQQLADEMGGGVVVAERAARLAGVPPEEIQLVDGSGLNPNNRISPRAVCALFAAIQRHLTARHLNVADVFPIFGRDGGTLEDRTMPKGATVKTGTLWNVSALAGAIPTRDRGIVWFAILNGGGDYVLPFRRGQDAFLEKIVQQWGTIDPPPSLSPSFPEGRLGELDRNDILMES